MLVKIRVRQHERGLLFSKGDFKELLLPGEYFRPGLLLGDCVELHDTLKPRFEHALLEVLLQNPRIRAAVDVVDLAEGERAIVWKDERLLEILGPGRYAYWKTPTARLVVETYRIDTFRFEHPRLQAILASDDAAKWFDGVMVSAEQDALLYRDGVLIERLGPGLHVFWKGTGKITNRAIDRREQVADVAGQEIMTSDKVTLRVNLLVT